MKKRSRWVSFPMSMTPFSIWSLYTSTRWAGVFMCSPILPDMRPFSSSARNAAVPAVDDSHPEKMKYPTTVQEDTIRTMKRSTPMLLMERLFKFISTSRFLRNEED